MRKLDERSAQSLHGLAYYFIFHLSLFFALYIILLFTDKIRILLFLSPYLVAHSLYSLSFITSYFNPNFSFPAEPTTAPSILSSIRHNLFHKGAYNDEKRWNAMGKPLLAPLTKLTEDPFRPPPQIGIIESPFVKFTSRTMWTFSLGLRLYQTCLPQDEEHSLGIKIFVYVTEAVFAIDTLIEIVLASEAGWKRRMGCLMEMVELDIKREGIDVVLRGNGILVMDRARWWIGAIEEKGYIGPDLEKCERVSQDKAYLLSEIVKEAEREQVWEDKMRLLSEMEKVIEVKGDN